MGYMSWLYITRLFDERICGIVLCILRHYFGHVALCCVKCGPLLGDLSHSVHSALPLDVSMEFAFRNHGIQLMWNSVDSMRPALIWEGTCYIRLPEVHNSVASQIHNGGVWNVRSTLPDYHTKYQGECIRHGAIQVGLAQWVDLSGLTSYIYQSIYICNFCMYWKFLDCILCVYFRIV